MTRTPSPRGRSPCRCRRPRVGRRRSSRCAGGPGGRHRTSGPRRPGPAAPRGPRRRHLGDPVGPLLERQLVEHQLEAPRRARPDDQASPAVAMTGRTHQDRCPLREPHVARGAEVDGRATGDLRHHGAARPAERHRLTGPRRDDRRDAVGCADHGPAELAERGAGHVTDPNADRRRSSSGARRARVVGGDDLHDVLARVGATRRAELAEAHTVPVAAADEGEVRPGRGAGGARQWNEQEGDGGDRREASRATPCVQQPCVQQQRSSRSPAETSSSTAREVIDAAARPLDDSRRQPRATGDGIRGANGPAARRSSMMRSAVSTSSRLAPHPTKRS